MPPDDQHSTHKLDAGIAGQTVCFLGKLAGLNRQEAARIVREAGGRVAATLGPTVKILVIGDDNVLSQDWNLWNDRLDDATREAFEAGTLEIVSESQFWEHFGLSPDDDPHKSSKTLYTPSMLAELTGLPLSTVRRLHRLGLIEPVRRVHRLCYFDFDSILPLRIVRSMLDGGLSLQKAVERLRRASRHFVVKTADVRLDGSNLLFSTSRGLVDQDGQRRFAFQFDAVQSEVVESPTVDPLEILDAVFQPVAEPTDFPTLCESAWALEAAGNLQGALDLYRAALAARPANPADGLAAQLHFQIAELLYRLGDLTAARERYFMAVESDETFVEARANLGCVLAELGRDDLAAAALRGALKFHPEYAEVHFHLGMLLHRAELHDEAEHHFQIFLELMPDSPWAARIPAK